jgi:hypothetical protein
MSTHEPDMPAEAWLESIRLGDWVAALADQHCETEPDYSGVGLKVTQWRSYDQPNVAIHSPNGTFGVTPRGKLTPITEAIICAEDDLVELPYE